MKGWPDGKKWLIYCPIFWLRRASLPQGLLQCSPWRRLVLSNRDIGHYIYLFRRPVSLSNAFIHGRKFLARSVLYARPWSLENSIKCIYTFWQKNLLVHEKMYQLTHPPFCPNFVLGLPHSSPQNSNSSPLRAVKHTFFTRAKVQKRYKKCIYSFSLSYLFKYHPNFQFEN